MSASAEITGRRQQRDLLRSAGEGRNDRHGDDGTACSDGAQGSLPHALLRQGCPFLVYAEDRRQGRPRTSDAGGSRDEGTGSAYDCGLLAAGAGPLGTQLLDLAGAAAPGVATARNQNSRGGKRISLRGLCGGVQPQIQSPGAAAWQRIPALPTQKPGPDLLATLRADRRYGRQVRCNTYGL